MVHQEGNNSMTDKEKKLVEAMKLGVVNRYHYNSLADKLVDVDSIFFDENHEHWNWLTAVNRIFVEYFFNAYQYNEYFKKYILEDLYYLGYIDRKDYLRLSTTSIDLTTNATFLNAVKAFSLLYGDKYEKRNAGSIWTNHLEIECCKLVVSKYFTMQDVARKNEIAKENEYMKSRGKRPIPETEKSDKKELKNNYIYNPDSYGVEVYENGNIVATIPVDVFLNIYKDIENTYSAPTLDQNNSKSEYEPGECVDGATNNCVIDNSPYPTRLEIDEEYFVESDDDPIELDPKCCADKNNIPWDSYFMGIAKLVRLRSKDPVCKVGACIIKNKKVLSTGYNGFPSGLDDNEYPWTKGSLDPTENKFFYVVHAELNAILNSDNPVYGSTLYVTKFPCNECAKAIIQAGISKIVYDDEKSDEEIFAPDKNHNFKLELAAKRMLEDAGIIIERYSHINNSVNIEL